MSSLKTRERLSEVRYEIRGELARRARELETGGRELIKLNIGNPGAFGFRAPEHLQRAITDHIHDTDPPTHQQGLPAAWKHVMWRPAMRARPQWLDSVLVALLAAAMLAGCMTRAPQSTTTRKDTSMHTLHYLALGDSYTIGESVAADARWPVQLADDLRGEGIAIDDPTIIAKTGWTTDELSNAIDATDPADDYDFVTLSIGVNNQYRGRDLDNYRDEFTALLQRAIGFAGGDAGRVLVLSIPDWGVSAFGRASGRDVAQIARELDAYNAAARDICAANSVAFVDVTPVSRERGAEQDMLADDGLHPSALMYGQWVALALPVASRLLADK